MSSSRKKRLGGCTEDPLQNSSRPTTPKSEKSGKKAIPIETTTEYKGKLRPRPTRQTNLFNTPVTAKKEVTSKQWSSSKKENTDSKPSTSKAVKRRCAERVVTDPILSPKAKSLRATTSGRQSSARKEKFIKAEVIPKKAPRSASATSRKKAPSSKSLSDNNIVVVTGTSHPLTQSQVLSSKLSNKKHKGSVSSKTTASRTIPVKSEALGPVLESQKPSKAVHSRLSKERPSTKNKTGSCGSTRRGSVRSQSSVVNRSSESGRLPPEPVKSNTSNTALMHKSKQSSDESTSRKRAANDTDGKSSRQSNAESSKPEGATAAVSSNNDSESDDPDVSRLQALLEARGLPPRLFSNLGPRMQQVLHRSMGTNSKVQRHLQGIQADGDESQQLQSAIELCQMLVMGNEDTLAGFPIKSAVPALTNLLKMEHNFDLMNHACRALTYMMEALPHSSAVVVDAIPILLEKLQTIQCIDVAEQSLTALDILSRRHASAVLAAGGVSSCLQYIDFFSLPAQRSALSIAANCCYAVGTIDTDISGPDEEFRKFMKASLPLLSTRLHHHDKKCIETTCLCFVRLIDSFQQDSTILNDIADVDLLKNFQKLIVEPTSLLSSSMLVLVIHSMTVLCSKLRKYASQLLEDDITETLYYLLCGKPSDGKSETVELLPRGSQETQEIASFIVQLLPRLPKEDPIFCVNSGSPTNGVISKTIAWQWSDNAGQWHSYKRHESRILEMAYSRGETEIDLHTGDRSVTISFDTMKLIDDNTGMNQPVQRILSTNNEDIHESTEDIKSDTKQLPNFVRVMLPVVVELYNTSAGFPSVRHVCLHALQRMVYYSSPTNLSTILEKLSLSSQISSMLSNQDTVIVVSAVQLADLLMRKLPLILKDMFVREGVVHRIKNLSQLVLPDDKRDIASPGTSRGSAKSSRKSTTSKTSPYALREQHSATKLRPRDQRGSSSSGRSSKVTKFAASFLSTMNPTSWKKSIASALSPKDEALTIERSSHSRSSEKSRHGNKTAPTPRSTDSAKSIETDKWLKKQANEFLDKHFKESRNKNDGKPDILQKLTETATALSNSSDNADVPLTSLREILDSVEVSPFEMIQSGVISALLHHLTTTNEAELFDKKKILNKRIKVFLSIYAGLVVDPDAPITGQIINSVKSLLNLVRKLNQCFGRLEQFPVKSRELMSESANIYHALTSRQIKCQLQRHPDCRTARRWLSGPIKIDPLIQMQAIEKYLIAKGYGSANGSVKQRLSASLLFHDRGEHHENDDDDDDDDDSDNDDIEEMGLDDADDFPDHDDDDHFEAEIFQDSRSSRRKQSTDNSTYSIELYMGNNKLPRQMTIYQALQQFGSSSRAGAGSASDVTRSSGASLLNDSGFWAKVHLLQYKLVKHEKEIESKTSLKSSKKSQSSKKVKEQSKNPVWFDGITPVPCSPLHNFLTTELPSDFGPIVDPSVEVLALLRILHAISRYWVYLYSPNLIQTNRPLVNPSVFINNEVNAKCIHQLEDPLVVITGQLSPWVQQVGRACPFLLSFETRQLLFKVTAFERNRALQHLHDTGITRTFSAHLGLSSSSSGNSRNPSNPFAPRIDKKKCSVSRKNLLQQAEKIIADHGSSLAMIEVDYENEVGTGLGPTLEFFTLTSKEIQNTKLKLWREELTSDDMSVSDEKASVDSANSHEIELVKTVAGLFPRPLSHSAKHSQISRLTSKFKFLGKFIGKALLDGRLVDIPLSIACYRWLLGEESSLIGMDLDYVDPGLASTFRKFCLVAHRREKILLHTPSEIDSLDMDGCSIEDLGLDMCLPGYASVELMKGGKTVAVTAQNLDKYLNLLVHWTLHEGVRHQMNALKEGFRSVIPLTNLSYFYPEELDLLFCGSRYRPWDVQELSEACRPDHGYTQDSEAVKILYKVLASFDAAEQRNFLQFVTGCPHLPFGGLRSLNPPLTVVRKTCETSENPDDYLPSVMTCLNYLKLPEYSSEEVMRAKLKVAVLEGQKSFLLS